MFWYQEHLWVAVAVWDCLWRDLLLGFSAQWKFCRQPSWVSWCWRYLLLKVSVDCFHWCLNSVDETCIYSLNELRLWISCNVSVVRALESWGQVGWSYPVSVPFLRKFNAVRQLDYSFPKIYRRLNRIPFKITIRDKMQIFEEWPLCQPTDITKTMI